MIDTHCHLNDIEAFPDPIPVIEEAIAAGVEQMIVIGCDEDSSRVAVQIAESHSRVFAVVGWHPTYCADFEESKIGAIRELASNPKVVAIGEVGFDFHWKTTTYEQQERSLRCHLDLAEELDLPVVFHAREAYSELLDVLEARARRPYLFHCFAGDEEALQRIVALDGVIGVDGPITFKKADELRRLVGLVSLDRIVLETDAPWLAPHPYRGKPCSPAMIPLINRALAAVHGVDENESAQRTSATARKFFGLPVPV